MSKRGLLSGSTLASRFPVVMRLLGGRAEAEESDDQNEPGDENSDTTDDDCPDKNDGDDAGGDDQTDDGNDSGGRQVGEGEGQGQEGSSASTTLEASQLSEVSRIQLLQAFERDANALIAAERERCCGVFTSEAGRRNPDGAAAVLRDTEMNAEKATAFLGTFGNRRSDQRDRLRSDASTRPQTGEGRENANETSDAKAAHRERQAQRNKRVPGGKKVGAPISASTED